MQTVIIVWIIYSYLNYNYLLRIIISYLKPYNCVDIIR